MAQRVTLGDIRARTYKSRDAWWTVWLTDPLASRLVWLVQPWRWVTPNRLSVFAFLLGAVAALCFWQGTWGWLAAGALLFQLGFVVDCMDGKIARLNGTGSVFGAWLDYVLDRFRVLVCVIGLFGGQYARTGDFVHVWLAGLVLFLDMFRYLNALQMGKVRTDMRTALPDLPEETDGDLPVGPAADPADIYADFRTQMRGLIRARNFLIRNRVRVHLVSGIEFMMLVFVVGPLLHAIVATTVTAAVLLAAFELVLIYKLWTATRSFGRVMATIPSPAPDAEPVPAGV